MLATLFNTVALLVSLSTATGVLFHDMRVDKAAIAMMSPVADVQYESNAKTVNFGGDLHVHNERMSFAQAVNDLKNQNPRIQPRSNDDKKHLMQKYVTRGHHLFDNYNLPLA